MALPEMKLPCGRCHKDPGLQVENGCLKDSPIPDRWQIGEHTFQRCPGSIVTQQSCEYLRAYSWKEKGFLPNPGGWLEQPAKFIKAMDVIEAESRRMEAEKEKVIMQGQAGCSR